MNNLILISCIQNYKMTFKNEKVRKKVLCKEPHQFFPISGMGIVQEVVGHLGLNAHHPREVLQPVFELMISSMDPWKRCHCFTVNAL